VSESQGVISPEEAVAITRELVADGELRQVDPPEWYVQGREAPDLDRSATPPEDVSIRLHDDEGHTVMWYAPAGPRQSEAINRVCAYRGLDPSIPANRWYAFGIHRDLLTLEAAVGEATDEVLSLLDTDATDEEVRATVEHLYGPFRGMQLSDDLEGYEELRFLLKELNGLLGRVERLDEEEA